MVQKKKKKEKKLDEQMQMGPNQVRNWSFDF